MRNHNHEWTVKVRPAERSQTPKVTDFITSFTYNLKLTRIGQSIEIGSRWRLSRVKNRANPSDFLWVQGLLLWWWKWPGLDSDDSRIHREYTDATKLYTFKQLISWCLNYIKNIHTEKWIRSKHLFNWRSATSESVKKCIFGLLNLMMYFIFNVAYIVLVFQIPLMRKHYL